jgi:glutathione S-transferase
VTYELYYWPQIQGRGEFIRLLLEDAGAPYVDVARLPKKEGGGVEAMMRILRGNGPGLRPFAAPFIKVDDAVIAQTANILAFLAPRHGLVPADEMRRVEANQLQLTIADVVAEVHETHHPIASALYYEDQRREAKARASHFVQERMPTFLRYFEDVLARNSASGGQCLVGVEHSYVDLSMFQLLSGLQYAFPNAFAKTSRSIPRLLALRDRVAARPRIAMYLQSERRIPFNQWGIFRHYPELDLQPKPSARSRPRSSKTRESRTKRPGRSRARE